MHREITPSDRLGHAETPLSLYLLTALLGLLLGADLWPLFVQWSGWSWLPTWKNEVFSYRFALIAAVLGGSRVLYGSLESLFEGRLGADLALAIACIAAILIGEPLVAAEIVFIGLLGEVLESITFTRSQRAIRSLLEVTPRRCWLLRDGQEVRILVSELKPGDVVVVKPGARIPGDGLVKEGRSAVDVGALTGESLPVEKAPGDEVLAGSMNQHGALTVEIARVAEQTVVGRVLTMTVAALQKKSQIERNADRYARYFLPVVLGLALITFLAAMAANALWAKLSLSASIRLSVYPALSVLVVACPCALILATPAAILAALGRLAGTGILIKGGSSLERLAEVDSFAFDKTGTLTTGQLELGDVIPLSDHSVDDLIRLAATAEQRSEHLLSRLIVAAASTRNLTLDPLDDFQAQPGAGVITQSSEGTLVVGTPRLMQEQGIALPNEATTALERLDASGQTSLLLAHNGVILGVIGARDRIRPEAADALTMLRNLGIAHISLLTGDRRAAAETVASHLGIEDVHSQLLPEDKAVHIANRRVAFVGDGINDAPALARAHVGLAVGGTGTEVAAEAGDIVFMGDPLKHLPLLLRLSRETVRIIRQNILYFAFAFNLVGVVLTAWLWPLFAPAGRWYEQSPLVAVLYHQLGSLLVLFNSMRLLWYDRKEVSPRVAGIKSRLDRVNQWMERNLNLDDWLHGLTHRWRRVLLGVAGLAVVLYAFSGITIVNADEVGVVRRFGRVLPDDLEPGFHWRYPWPVEEVSRVQNNRFRTVEVGFRGVPGKTTSDTRTWSSAHGDAFRRYPDEAVMITGDDNLIEVLATLQYTISDVRVYLFEVQSLEETLRSATEGVLRELVAGHAFTPLLTRERIPMQELALQRLRERCGHLGVKLESLTLQELHPPPEVVPSFHDVARAVENEQEQINKAKASETERLAAATGQKLRIEREGDSERQRVLLQAQAGLNTFLDRLSARNSLSLEQELRLLYVALSRVKADQPQDEINAVYAMLRREELARQKQWTGERLQREVLARTLPGRELVLVDGPMSMASLLYALEQVREVFGPLFAPRPMRTGREEEP